MAGLRQSEWLNQPSNIDLYVQALYQSEGYGIALLIAEHRREEGRRIRRARSSSRALASSPAEFLRYLMTISLFNRSQFPVPLAQGIVVQTTDLPAISGLPEDREESLITGNLQGKSVIWTLRDLRQARNGRQISRLHDNSLCKWNRELTAVKQGNSSLNI